MKRVYIWGWHSKSQIAALESLQDSGDAEIAKWYSNARNSKYNLNDVIHRPLQLETSSCDIPDEKYTQLYNHFITFSDMYSRVTFAKGLSHQELINIFNLYIHYFYNDLKKTEADIVLFSTFPHFGADYILYLCAQAQGIKTVITFQTLFPNRFFAVESLADYLNITKQPKHSNNALKIEKTVRKEFFYMKGVKNRKKSCCLSLIRDITRLLLPQSKPMSLTGAVQKFQECRTFNTVFFKIIEESADFDKKYVYFPLQLQPEMTTSMLGGIYSDQLLALEKLSSLIPDDWLIYAKENPKQTPRQRGAFFFKRLQSIKKVKYLSTSINTHQLIENAQFVSVATGTAGWEAISGGRKVVTFGHPWYGSLPGVFQYREDLDIAEVLNFKIDHSELEARLNALLDVAYEGVIDPSYNQIVENYSDEKNTEYLKSFLKYNALNNFTR